jgi:carboxypeptidase C (cathepsin A)
MRDVSGKLVPLLEDGVPVMIYAGDKDLICNHVGNRRWVDGLEWSGQAAWAQAKDEDWVSGGGTGGATAAAGSVASSGPLTFVRIFDAGHMSPRDQPQPLLYMISRFIYGKELVKAAAAEAEGVVEQGPASAGRVVRGAGVAPA